MKKTQLILLLITLFTKATHAQVGLEAGLNMANLAIESGGTKVSTKFRPGAAMGLFGDLRLDQNGHVYFEPGAYYQNDGAGLKGTPSGKYIINSANFPLNIEYKTGYKCGRRFFVGIGPYIGVNLNGSIDYNSANGINGSATELVIGTSIKQIDYGFGVNLGYINRKHLFARLHYQLGLDNEVPSGDSKNYIKQSSAGLTIGYMIGGCRARSAFGGYRRHRGQPLARAEEKPLVHPRALPHPQGAGYISIAQNMITKYKNSFV